MHAIIQLRDKSVVVAKETERVAKDDQYNTIRDGNERVYMLIFDPLYTNFLIKNNNFIFLI